MGCRNDILNSYSQNRPCNSNANTNGLFPQVKTITEFILKYIMQQYQRQFQRHATLMPNCL